MSNKKKVLVVGASGTLGKCVSNELSKKHEVIRASRSSSDIKIDIADKESIKSAFKKLGKIDAVVCTAGEVFFGDFEKLTEEQFYKGIQSKMMGQINLVLIGKDYVNDNGSFTLTTGILADEPISGSTNSTTVNNAIHGFVLSASKELKRGIRINAVCPGLVEASVSELGHLFPGYDVIPMDRTANGYLKSVEGIANGQVIKIY